MVPRYIVRRAGGELRYSVFDCANNSLAVSEGRDCADLGFTEAFRIADDLNAQNMQPKEK